MKPIYAFWAERGMLAPGFKGRKVPARTALGALNRNVAVR